MNILRKLSERTNNASSCRPVLIAFLGDSVTHGCFEVFIDRFGEIGVEYEPDSAYPYRLKRRLDLMYPAAAVSILNAGVSGESSKDGAKRIERDVIPFHPDLVVIAFALNDSMNGDGGLDDYRNAMKEMIQKVKESGAECIVLTPSFMCGYVSSHLKDEALREIAEKASRVQNAGILARYAETARETAKSLGVPVADAYSVWEKMAANGVDTTRLLSNHINHPTRDMHDIFVEAILGAMLSPDAQQGSDIHA